MRLRSFINLSIIISAGFIAISKNAQAKLRSVEEIQKDSASEIKNIIDPVLQKYCQDRCEILGVKTEVDMKIPEEVAPGFDEQSAATDASLAPASASVRILMDDLIGPITRQKLVKLLEEYLTKLDYPVVIETKLNRFPQPVSSMRKVAEIRQEIFEKFQKTVNATLDHVCQDRCLLTEVEIQADQVNLEETQFETSNDIVQSGEVAVKVNTIRGTILVDASLSPEERADIAEMARLKTSFFKNVEFTAKAMNFPNIQGLRQAGGGAKLRGLSSASSSEEFKENNSDTYHTKSDSNHFNNETKNNKSESFSRYETIQKVENGDAVHQELLAFKKYLAIFAGSILLLIVCGACLFFFSGRRKGSNYKSLTERRFETFNEQLGGGSKASSVNTSTFGIKVEIQSLLDELTQIFAEQPKVAKQVFSRILAEDGIEITAGYLEIFGDSIIVDLLRDASLQHSMNELLEYYSKTQIDLSDEEKLELLRRLHNRTVAGKLIVMGKRSSGLFDFLVEMDAMQIHDMIKNESVTVKAIILTQCDQQKRNKIYNQIDKDTRLKLLSELSRIDYLPRDYIQNVASALKRKKVENPRLNTEALPGSEVLVGLLEKAPLLTQRSIIKNVEGQNPDAARAIKSKLVSIETLAYLRDNQLLEIVLNLKHEELLQFLKGSPDHIRDVVFSKSPPDLAADLKDELENIRPFGSDVYQTLERKVLNRIKLLTNDGAINLAEVNERMFSAMGGNSPNQIISTTPGELTGSLKVAS